MLPAAHRLTDSDSFRVAVRSGRRSGSTTVVVHLLTGPGGAGAAEPAPGDFVPAQVGFVVSKAVGNAVVRNRVKRRLRHLTREHLALLGALPGPVVLVVRALPDSAHASYAQLGRDLGRCLARVTA